MPSFSDDVFAAVRRIPRGRVASYGLVARAAGRPGAARQVGMVMRLGRGLPWWRVLAQDGRIVVQNPELRFEQALRLREEGVEVSEALVVDYERFAWRPRNLTAASPAPRAGSPPGPPRRPRPSSPTRRR